MADVDSEFDLFWYSSRLGKFWEYKSEMYLPPPVLARDAALLRLEIANQRRTVRFVHRHRITGRLHFDLTVPFTYPWEPDYDEELAEFDREFGGRVYVYPATEIDAFLLFSGRCKHKNPYLVPYNVKERRVPR